MGIRDFFKKKSAQELEPEKISFGEIENWLNKKNWEIKGKEEEVFFTIKEKIDSFFKELEKKVKVLEAIDVETKKVEGRAKVIVKQSLDKYLIYVNIFTKELRELKQQSLEKFIREINKVFSDFDKHSYLFYQRSTFLIGDEIAAVKNEINNFSKELTKLFEESGEILVPLRKMSELREELNQLSKTNKNLDKLNLEIGSLENEITGKKDSVKKINEEIGEIKKSNDYLENRKLHEEIKSEEKHLERNFLELKELIDFKKMGNLFHSNEKEMELVKSFKGDFRTAVQKDGGETLIKMLDESGTNSKVIRDKLEKIKNKAKEIEKNKKIIKEDEAKKLEKEIKNIELLIENLKIERAKQIKRYENLEREKENILSSIRENINELGGEIE